MIFSSMEYPGKDYRVQVYDSWLGEELEPMDNPKDGDKIVYRIIGENGQPVEQKTEVYQNGAWVEVGGGGSSIGIDVPLFSCDMKIEGTPPAPVFSNPSCSVSYEELDAVYTENGGSYPCAVKTFVYNPIGEVDSISYSGGNLSTDTITGYTTIYAGDSTIVFKYDNDGTLTILTE